MSEVFASTFETRVLSSLNDVEFNGKKIEYTISSNTESSQSSGPLHLSESPDMPLDVVVIDRDGNPGTSKDKICKDIWAPLAGSRGRLPASLCADFSVMTNALNHTNITNDAALLLDAFIRFVSRPTSEINNIASDGNVSGKSKMMVFTLSRPHSGDAGIEIVGNVAVYYDVNSGKPTRISFESKLGSSGVDITLANPDKLPESLRERAQKAFALAEILVKNTRKK